jgi:hypothetical protein
MHQETYALTNPGTTLVETKPLPPVSPDQTTGKEHQGIDAGEEFGSPPAIHAEPQSSEFTSPPAWLQEPVQWTLSDTQSPEPAVEAEITATQEKAPKASKLGKLVVGATVQMGKVFNSAMSRIGALSVMTPGSGIYFAEKFSDAEYPDKKLTKEEVIGRIESRGYVKKAPRFADQVRDSSRTNTFRYARTPSSEDVDEASPDTFVELTEHDGLVGLRRFLKEYIKAPVDKSRHGLTKRKQTARSMLQSLTFIGAKEYAEAAEGIGEYWKAYLNEDPRRQICIPPSISRQEGRRKSDMYLAENILDSFSDDELERYSGRIVTEFVDIIAEPENVKVILLDDWTISGSQMRGAFSGITSSKGLRPYATSVEVNLIVATTGRIEKGLTVKGWDASPSIPVSSYYLAHESVVNTEYEQQAHITGTHSSVDYDFESVIRDMIQDREPGGGFKKPERQRLKMPPLTNIVRTYYRSTPKVKIQKGGKIIRTHGNHS